MLTLSVGSMQSMLRTVYDEMVTFCEPMSSVACGLAGLAATIYISYRVLSALGRGEPIDVFGLLRPFAIGIAIMTFNVLVVRGLNGILSPISNATYSLVKGQEFELERALDDQKDIIKNAFELQVLALYGEDAFEEENFYKLVEDEEFNQLLWHHVKMQMEWGFKSMIRKVVQWILELLHKAAVIVLDVIRTFFLIVLAIFGPISFAISIFDGFQNTMTQWFARYVSIYLWLPITDIYGAIIAKFQTLMIRHEINQVVENGYYDSENLLSLIFLIVAICGYFTIPTLSNWIIQAGGIGSANRGINMTAVYLGNKSAAYTGAASGSLLHSANRVINSPINLLRRNNNGV